MIIRIIIITTVIIIKINRFIIIIMIIIIITSTTLIITILINIDNEHKININHYNNSANDDRHIHIIMNTTNN